MSSNKSNSGDSGNFQQNFSGQGSGQETYVSAQKYVQGTSNIQAGTQLSAHQTVTKTVTQTIGVAQIPFATTQLLVGPQTVVGQEVHVAGLRKDSQQSTTLIKKAPEIVTQRVSSPGQRVVIRSDSPQPKRLVQSPASQQYLVREVREGQTNPHTVYVTRTADIAAAQAPPAAATATAATTVQLQALSAQQGQFLRQQVLQIPIQEKLIYIEDTRSKELVIELQRQIVELKEENARLRIQANQPPIIQEKEIFIEDDTKVRHLEGKLAVLIMEIEKLNGLIITKGQEIEQYQKSVLELEQLVSQRQAEITFWHQRAIDLEHWKVQSDENTNKLHLRIRELEEQLQFRISDNERIVREFEFRIKEYTQQLEILNNSLKLKLDEYEQLRQKFNQLDLNYRNALQQHQVYEDKVQSQNAEIERLTAQLRARLDEIEQLKTFYGQREIQLNRSYDTQVQEYQRRIEELRAYISDLEGKYTTLQKENVKIRVYEEDIKRYQELLQQRTREIEEWRVKYSQIQVQCTEYIQYQDRAAYLAQEIDRLNKLLREQEEQLSVWRYKYAEFADQESKNRDLLSLLVVCFAEIEALRAQLTSAARESQQLHQEQISLRLSQHPRQVSVITTTTSQQQEITQPVRVSTTKSTRYV